MLAKNDLLVVEGKERENGLPLYIENALNQAASYTTDGQIPIVVWHKLCQRHDSDVVMMRLKHFEELWGEVPNVWRQDGSDADDYYPSG